jgi:hypothetical protein
MALVRRKIPGSDEDRWRAAALVHDALAHPGWRAGGPTDARPPWLDDAEARWLIGVHEADGATWFREESFAQLVRWRTLPLLLEAVDAPPAERTAARHTAERWSTALLAEAQAAQWRYDTLLANEHDAEAIPAAKVRADEED